MIYVGQPHYHALERYGAVLYSAYGETAYLVGSATQGREWRDVDVRIIMPDKKFRKMFPDGSREGPKWAAHCEAFSVLGREITGLPIDFQIQQMTRANQVFGGRGRHPLNTWTQVRVA